MKIIRFEDPEGGIRLGEPIDWDAAAMKAAGCPEADPLIHREYRKGWEL